MRRRVFGAFRRFANILSGHELRLKLPIFDHVYRRLAHSLSPRTANVLGHVMYLDHGDSMGLSLGGIYEPDETRIVRENVKLGDTALDIGANIGYYTLFLAQLVGNRGCVIAFEPDPTSFALLEKNISANNYRNVQAVEKAVSNHTGQTMLYIDPYHTLDHRIYEPDESRSRLVISEVKLDDFFEHREADIDFIKMDIQGSEGLALEGMTKLLKRQKTIKIMTEFWPYGLEKCGYAPKSLLGFLSSLDFLLFDMRGSGGLEDPVSCEELLETYQVDPYVHTNLMCVK